MTVSSSTNKVSYSGNGSLTTFAYTFKIFDEDDLTVILRASDGTETTQTITTHYTVTGVGEASGGNVVFGSAPASGVTVVIIREQPLTQGLDLVPNDPFPAESLEEALDKLTFMSQKHEEELSRAIKASRTNTLTGSEFTVSAADRANKVFAFDSSGNLTVTQELGTFKGDWAASTSYVERDLVKDTTTNDVFIVNAAHTSSGSLPLTTNTNSSKYDKIIDVSSPAGDLTVGGNISTTGSITGGSFVIGSADINENDLEAIDEVVAGTVAASKAVVVDVNKDISSFRNLTASGTVTYGSLSDGSITVTAFVDEDNMASDSATLIPTQQSVKAYVDAQVATADALSEVLGNGNTTGGTNIVVDSGDTLDVNGALDANGTIKLDGNYPTGTDNVALGNTALDTAASGSLNNTGIGSAALTALTTGSDNTAVGYNALTALNTGLDNVGIGSNAGPSITDGTGNVAVGDIAAFSLTSGDGNVAVGNAALRTATTPSHNVAIGLQALYLNLTGAGNIALGKDSGYNITSGSKNVIIGSYDGNEGGLDIRTSSNNLVLSDGDGNIRLYANSSGNVGIANVSPSTALDVTGTVTATGGAFTGDVTFGDNNKAIFGAGSDLQIYHDGSDSYISDQGTGNLKILAGEFNVKSASGNTDLIYGVNGGAVTLYHNGNAKIATTSTGIDVTGTVTADGLTVDGTTSVPVVIDSNQTDTAIQFKNSGYDDAYIEYNDNNLFFYTDNKRFLSLASNGDISFYEDTGTTAKFFWDASAERLGIGDGTSTPPRTLHLKEATPAIRLTDSTANDYAEIVSTDGDLFLRADHGNTHAGSRLSLQVDGTDALYIDDSLNVGIGTSSPSAPLDVRGSGASLPTTSSVDVAYFARNGNSVVQIISTPSTAAILAFGDTDARSRGAISYYNSDNSLRTTVNGSERMRIDSSGRVGIGTTSPSSYNANADNLVIEDSGNAGITIATTDSAYFSQLNFARGTSGSQSYVGMLRYAHADDSLRILTNTTEQMRIDSSGNVGIATTSPRENLSVVNTNLSDNGQQSFIRHNQYFSGSSTVVENSSYGTVQIGLNRQGTGALTFETGPVNTTTTERMRIDSSGNLLVGTTSGALAYTTNSGAAIYPDGSHVNSRDGGICAYYNRITSNGDIVVFNKSGVTVGSISVTASATAYNTSSDRRLKENIADADDAGSLIDAIQVRKFDWKTDGTHQRYGLVAQELNHVFPEAVSIPDNEEEMQSVDYSKLVPMLVKEIQSLRNRITELEAN